MPATSLPNAQAHLSSRPVYVHSFFSRKAQAPNVSNASRNRQLRTAFTYLLSGVFISQLIILVTTPMVSRLYSVSDIGQLNALLAMAGSLVPFITLALPRIIVPSTDDGEAVLLAHRGIQISIALCALLFGLMLILMVWPGTDFSLKVGGIWLWLPLITLIQSLSYILTATVLRSRTYRLLSLRPGAQSLTTGVAQVSASLLGSNSGLLAAGEALGRGLGLALLVRPYLALRRKSDVLRASPRVLRRHLALVARVLPASALDILATSFLVLSALFFYGDEIAGYVGMTQRLLAVPVALIGAALGQSLLAEFAHSRRSHEDFPGLRRLVIALCLFALAFALGIGLFGPWIFETFLGAEWRPAGEFARLIAVPASVAIVWNPLSAIALSLSKWGFLIKISLLRVLLAGCISIVSFHLGADWFVALSLLVASGAIVQLAGLLAIRKFVRELKD